jgi:hypothetical protein
MVRVGLKLIVLYNKGLGVVEAAEVVEEVVEEV